MTARRSPRQLLAAPELWVALFACVIAAYSQWPALTGEYVINDDSRIHNYWMQRWSDPRLFEHDPLTDYSMAYQSWGYLAIYRLAAVVLDPLDWSRCLPLLLLPWTALAFFRLASRLESRTAGLLAAAWVTLAPIVLLKMSGGHARAFALPLMASAFLCFLRPRPLAFAGLTLLTASVYPMAFFLVLGACGLLLVEPSSALRWQLNRRLAVALVMSALAGGALLAARSATVPTSVGSIATRAEIEGRPELGPRGIYPVYPPPPLLGILGQEVRRSTAILPPSVSGELTRTESVGRKIGPLDVVLLLVVGGLCLAAPWLRLPLLLPALLLSGTALFALSELLLMRLYLPIRYIQYSARFVVPLLGAIALARLLSRVRAAPQRRALAAVPFTLLLFNVPVLAGLGLSDHSADAPLFRFVHTLPVDALIAAEPHLADSIPIFSGRRVFTDYEHSLPFFMGYWERSIARTRAFYRAYYAADRGTVCAVLAEHGITHLVVDREHFTARHFKRRRLLFEPFDSEIRAAVRGREAFALAELGEREVVFSAGRVRVVTPASLGCPPSPPAADRAGPRREN